MAHWTTAIFCFILFLVGLEMLVTIFANDVHLTCDFDLDNLDQIIQELPEKCIRIYEERVTNAELYDKYFKEANKFNEFFQKLDKYELGPIVEANEVTENTVYPFNKEVRKQIYETGNLTECLDIVNNTDVKYLDCVVAKRTKMILAIPDAN